MSEYSRLIGEIGRIFSEKKQDVVELNGVKGRTFFLKDEITINGLFVKDERLHVNVSGDYKSERRLDDFTYESVTNIIEKLVENKT